MNVDDLKGHAAIAYLGSERRDTSWLIPDAKGRSRDAGVNVRMRLDNLQAVADAAIASLGLASLPNWLFPPYLRSGELVLLMDCTWVEGIDIHGVWPQTQFLPAKTRVAIDAMVTQIPFNQACFARIAIARDSSGAASCVRPMFRNRNA